MKRFFLISIVCIQVQLVNFVEAQALLLQGKIIYKKTLNIKRGVNKNDSSLTTLLPLKISGTEALTFNGEQYAVLLKWDEPEHESFYSLAMLLQADQRNIANLKSGSSQLVNIIGGQAYYNEKKMEPEGTVTYIEATKEILGYTCKKAVIHHTDSTQAIVWYTTAIPYAYHPNVKAIGLKGAILEYSTPTDSCVAIDINTNTVDAAEITLSNNARKVTPTQLVDIMLADAIH